MKEPIKKSQDKTMTTFLSFNFLELKELLRRWALNIIENKRDLYPKGVIAMLATPDKNSFVMSLELGNELGFIRIIVDMKYVKHGTILNYKSFVTTEKSTKEKKVIQDDLNALESKYAPVVKSFMNMVDDVRVKKE